jgi:hypothetical protein
MDSVRRVNIEDSGLFYLELVDMVFLLSISFLGWLLSSTVACRRRTWGFDHTRTRRIRRRQASARLPTTALEVHANARSWGSRNSDVFRRRSAVLELG